MLPVLGVFGRHCVSLRRGLSGVSDTARFYKALQDPGSLMSSDFTALKHGGDGGPRARISTGPPSFLKEYQSLQVPGIWVWLLRVLVCFCSQLTVSGREMQKKEIHIKRDSHTHANKAKALQRCGDPKNEHIERQAEKGTHAQAYTYRHNHRYTDALHTRRETWKRRTEFQRDTCRMSDVQRQICIETSRQHRWGDIWKNTTGGDTGRGSPTEIQTRVVLNSP